MKITYTREEWRKVVENDAKCRANKGANVTVNSYWQSVEGELFSVEVSIAPVEVPPFVKVTPNPITADNFLKGM